MGKILDHEWPRTCRIRPGVTLDEYVIMPDHFHAILSITVTNPIVTNPVGAHAAVFAVPGSQWYMRPKMRADERDSTMAPIIGRTLS